MLIEALATPNCIPLIPTEYASPDLRFSTRTLKAIAIVLLIVGFPAYVLGQGGPAEIIFIIAAIVTIILALDWLYSKFSNLNYRAGRMQDRIDDKLDEEIRLTSERNSLQSELSPLQTAFNNRAEEIRQERGERTQINIDISTKSQQLETAIGSQRVRLEEELATLRARSSALTQSIGTKSNENLKLKVNQIDPLNTQIRTLINQISEASYNRGIFESQLRDIENDREATWNNIVRKDGELAAKRARLAELQEGED